MSKNTVNNTRIRLVVKEYLAPEEKATSSRDEATMKGYKTKLENFRTALKAFGKGNGSLSSEHLGAALFSMRRDAKALEVVPSSPELQKMYADIVAQAKADYAKEKAAFEQENPDGKFHEFEIDGYYAFLGQGTEARARGHEMDRMMSRGATHEQVFAYHLHTVEQFRALVESIKAHEALLQ